VLDALSIRYTLRLDHIGSFEATLPALPAIMDAVQVGRRIDLHVEGEGRVFRGVIEHVEYGERGDQRVVSCAGGSIARQLAWKSTLLGRQFSAATLGSVVSTLLTGTGWVAGTVDTPSTALTIRYDGRSVWDALADAARAFGLWLRESHLTDPPAVDVSAFSVTPSVLLTNTSEVTNSEAPGTGLITDIEERIDALQVVNRVIPIGQMTGLQGATSWLTLQTSTRTTPYAIQSATGPDGKTYWYIQDSASISAYGLREQVLAVRDITPLGTADTDIQQAANTLYDEAVSFLQRSKDPVTTYSVAATGLRHLSGGSPVIRVGDPIRILYRGVIRTEGGAQSIRAIDTSACYIMSFTRTMTEDADNWALEVSSVRRELPNDGNVTEMFLEAMQGIRSTPLPYVLFGDNTMRISAGGHDLSVPDSSGITGSPERKVRWWKAGGFVNLVGEMWMSFHSTLNSFGARRVLNRGTDSIIDDLIYDYSQNRQYLGQRLWYGGGLYNWEVYSGIYHPTGPVSLLGLRQVNASDAELEILRGGTMVPVGMSIVDVAVFTASGTWTKPSSAKLVEVFLWSAGGGGGSGGGGGGGGLVRKVMPASMLGSTVAVTIGAGGAGHTGSGTGAGGGASSFGSWLTVNGGGGGLSPGYSGPSGGGYSGTVVATLDCYAGGSGASGNNSAGSSAYGGGGGGNSDGSGVKAGGSSIYGGGGGGGGGAGVSFGADGGSHGRIGPGGGGAGSGSGAGNGQAGQSFGHGGGASWAGAGGNGNTVGGGGAGSTAGGNGGNGYAIVISYA
jgi:hypothetical protein